jgi:hypothetical protein
MSIFTKKHYEFIAKVLSDAEACDMEVESWCEILANENPAFDEEKFKKAAFAYAEGDEG